jgi:hypothetical protein
MEWTPAAQETLKRFFRYGFRAADVAEALVSVDADRPSADVRALMERRLFDVVGVREEGLVTGYVELAGLADGPCGRHARPFSRVDVMDAETPLHIVIGALAEAPHVFVSSLGSVAGIITPDDMEKPAARLWLFGLVTVLEMAFGRLIRMHHPGDGWTGLLSPKRIEKAVALQGERTRNGHDVELVDCLQFSDKATVIFRTPELFEQFQFESRRTAKRAANRVERLRNDLAHAHPIVAENWDQITRFSLTVDRLLELLEVGGEARRSS